MGNQQNSSNAEKKKEIKNVIAETKNRELSSFLLINSKDNNSSYKGVKTSGNTSSVELEKDIKTLATECTTTPDKLDSKAQTFFEWKDGGNVVYITGTFSNWSQWFIMAKNNNSFELNLVNISQVN